MKILVAVDGSEASMAAVRTIKERPWPPGSTVRVVTVVGSFFVLPEAAAIDYERLIGEAEREADEVTRRTVEELSPITAEPTVRRGDPRAEILEEAERWQADLIVLGSHGRSGLKRLFMGSVAEYVVRHASCSVEVARHRTPSSKRK